MSELKWNSRLLAFGGEEITAIASLDDPFIMYEVKAEDMTRTKFRVIRTMGEAEEVEECLEEVFTSLDAAKQAAQQWENQRPDMMPDIMLKIKSAQREEEDENGRNLTPC
jgi:hypothetical protein